MRLSLLFLLSTLLFISPSCNDEDETPMPPEDNQAIGATILRIVLTGGTQPAQTVSYREVPAADPAMPPPPEVDDIVLEANTSYSYRLIVQGENNGGVRNYNMDIEENGEDYLITFAVLAADLAVTSSDTDSFGAPIGLTGNFQTGAPSSGVLMFDLFFETDKTTPGGIGSRLLDGDFRVEIQ